MRSLKTTNVPTKVRFLNTSTIQTFPSIWGWLSIERTSPTKRRWTISSLECGGRWSFGSNPALDKGQVTQSGKRSVILSTQIGKSGVVYVVFTMLSLSGWTLVLWRICDVEIHYCRCIQVPSTSLVREIGRERIMVVGSQVEERRKDEREET